MTAHHRPVSLRSARSRPGVLRVLLVVSAAAATTTVLARAGGVVDQPTEHHLVLAEDAESGATLVLSLPQGVWETPLSSHAASTGPLEGRALHLCYCSDPRMGGRDASCVVLVEEGAGAEDAKQAATSLDAAVTRLTTQLESQAGSLKDRPEPMAFRSNLKGAGRKVPLFGTSFSVASGSAVTAFEAVGLATGGRTVLVVIQGNNLASKFLDGLGLARKVTPSEALTRAKFRLFIPEGDGSSEVCVTFDVPKDLARRYPHPLVANRTEEVPGVVARWERGPRDEATGVLTLRDGVFMRLDLDATWTVFREQLGEAYTVSDTYRTLRIPESAAKVRRYSATAVADGRETAVEFAVLEQAQAMWVISWEEPVPGDDSARRKAAATYLDRVIGTLRAWATRQRK